MTVWLILPILIPLVTGIALLLTKQQKTTHLWLHLLGSGGLLLSSLGLLYQVSQSGILAVAVGNWAAPFGIALVADTLSAVMVAVTGFVGLWIGVYSLANIDSERVSAGYYPLYHFLLMGVNGAFLTGDLFNLYVWFEVMLMSSFVLLALGGEKRQIHASITYVSLNLLSSTLFLIALGILYGKAGTLNMADLAVKISQNPEGILITAPAILLMVAFGIKAGLFPLYFWLPAAYHIPPVAVSAIFAGLLTKVGVYALIRVFTLIFTQNIELTHSILLIFSGLTMLFGVFGAVSQFEFRRILSFHIISQIGYMTLGLALFTKAALAATVFYLVHHIIVKSNLFLLSGVAQRLHGTLDLKKMGGLYHHYPFLAALFLIPALSLGGIPPLSGFFAKFALIKAGLVSEAYLAMTIALIVGLFTLMSMIKIWVEVFWKKSPENTPIPVDFSQRIPRLYLLPIIVMALATLYIGLQPEALLHLANQAAEQLLNPQIYIQSVLGG